MEAFWYLFDNQFAYYFFASLSPEGIKAIQSYCYKCVNIDFLRDYGWTLQIDANYRLAPASMR